MYRTAYLAASLFSPMQTSNFLMTGSSVKMLKLLALLHAILKNLIHIPFFYDFL